MSYTLQAVVAKSGSFPENLPEKLQVLNLRCGIDMIPITTEARHLFGISSLPLTDGVVENIPPELAKLCETLSNNCMAAYIEAEFFGGAGMQAHVLLSEGKIISPVVASQAAINEALCFLGITKGKYHDEFEAIGLGRHSFTDDWNSNDLPSDN